MIYGYNAYNTTDPRQLLLLKRQEADAMLEIVRSVNPSTKPDDLITLVVNTIRKQLGVRRIQFVVQVGPNTKVAISYGFPDMEDEYYGNLRAVRRTLEVHPDNFEDFYFAGVEYIIPLGQGEIAEAWFLIAEFAESEAEVQNDLIFIETAGNILAMSLTNMRLYEEKVEQKRLEAELEFAAKVQQSSFPDDFEVHKGLDISAKCIQHRKIGGDFYDLISISADEVIICIGDAAGKGIPAALLISTIHASIRALVEAGQTLEAIVRQLDMTIGRITKHESFATLFIGKFNIPNRHLQYINAGHNPPFIVGDNGIRELLAGCIPLGILHLDSVHVGEETLGPDDLLFLYTDGAVEQANPRQEIMGSDALCDRLHLIRFSSADTIVADVLQFIDFFAEGTERSDDLTVMAIKLQESLN